jgi:predicted O-methyltransferase YrrM
LKRLLRNAVKKLPYLREVYLKGGRVKPEISKGSFWFPPGHFYSPIPAIEEVRQREEEIFNKIPGEIPGIDLNVEEQLELLNKFKKYYKEQPFGSRKREGLRFYFENPSYSYSDAIVLYCMIRYLQPKKIIEVGSGYSSCIILDTNELFFGDSISCTFIEPYPQLLQSLIKGTDKMKIEVIQKNLQDVNLDKFSELAAGDIFFVDSTHVSKINSDVNYIFFKILPYLKSGVCIHFHDIFYPFEYPKEWVYQGLAWNETYLLRAFLQYNNAFKIQFFNTYLEHFHREEFFDEMPIPLKYVGASIWIKKV